MPDLRNPRIKIRVSFDQILDTQKVLKPSLKLVSSMNLQTLMQQKKARKLPCLKDRTLAVLPADNNRNLKRRPQKIVSLS
jgi:hypothetical protein